MSYQLISQQLEALKNPERAVSWLKYFPRNAELGDRQDLFYGVSVPETRQIAKKYKDLDFVEIAKLLKSNYHEERLCGLVILRIQLDKSLKKADNQAIIQIKNFYIKHLPGVDHWDLVDESAGNILGRILVYLSIEKFSLEGFLKQDDFLDSYEFFTDLQKLASSSNIWHKRISIIASFAYIKKGNLDIPLSICKYHIKNKHHYIQKACGWVLREVGKNNKTKLDKFLIKNINHINSICLSYALQKHSKAEKDEIRGFRKG